jgi:hypothetical protein
VSILWWLAVPIMTTGIAMVWATWAGRPRRPLPPDESSDAYDRFTEALRRPLPERARAVARRQPERLAGVALRPNRNPGGGQRPWRPGAPPRANTRGTGG